jgi:hypothetical protein
LSQQKRAVRTVRNESPNPDCSITKSDSYYFFCPPWSPF